MDRARPSWFRSLPSRSAQIHFPAWLSLALSFFPLARLLPAAASFSTAPSRGCPLHAALARRGAPAAAALALYSRIRAAATPTPYTFSLLLSSLASSSSSPRSPSPDAGVSHRLAAAGLAHAQVLKWGALAHTVVTNCLLKLYCALGLLPDARRVFDTAGAAALDTISWNTMVSGYGKSGNLGGQRSSFSWRFWEF
jgi:hypothetical protein